MGVVVVGMGVEFVVVVVGCMVAFADWAAPVEDNGRETAIVVVVVVVVVGGLLEETVGEKQWKRDVGIPHRSKFIAQRLCHLNNV